jgi:hypothetical protein
MRRDWDFQQALRKDQYRRNRAEKNRETEFYKASFKTLCLPDCVNQKKRAKRVPSILPVPLRNNGSHFRY